MDSAKKVTHYTYGEVSELTTPETGHTMLLPSDEAHETVEMDPMHDPQLIWSGKKHRNDIPILPLQRNEIVSESRIAQIIERVRKRVREESGQTSLTSYFELEKALREQDRSRRVEFYRHEQTWKNKLICGDSLLVMESLLHYEALRGKVQMIYIDPPYGIRYDSNFQQRVDSTKNDEKERADDILTVKAFRDTWALGIHSYLSYLQERLYLCRELLHETGSIFVQMNQENSHLVRVLMDEVFGAANFVSSIVFTKTGGMSTSLLAGVYDTLLWYSKSKPVMKYNQLYVEKKPGGPGTSGYIYVESPDGKQWRAMTSDERKNPELIPKGWRVFDGTPLVSAGESKDGPQYFDFNGKRYSTPPNTHYKAPKGMPRLAEKGRIIEIGNRIEYKRYFDDFPYFPIDNIWYGMGERGFVGEKWYAVQTDWRVVGRCICMTTDPCDLVFDPTCGGGTSAYAAERFGRRWITCDTSRVAINITRKRLMSAVLKHYKTRNGAVSSGFVYRTAQHIQLQDIAHDLEPAKVELVDDPVPEEGAIRVTGPFDVMTIGRYSAEDWKGYVKQSGKLENYIGVICHLYRKDAALQSASGLVHAVWESEGKKIAITVGPLSGRVTGKQLTDAVQDSIASGISEIHVLGWAFEVNVGEVKSNLESRGKIQINLVMIRPDTLVEGLKATSPETLFSPYALPDIEVIPADDRRVRVVLKGIAIFDRQNKTTDYQLADSGYVSAWYLDEDYDGDCFVDCQMFFDFPKKMNIDRIAGRTLDMDEKKLSLTSEPFKISGYKHVAVKVVDVFGNESTVVREVS